MATAAAEPALIAVSSSQVTLSPTSGGGFSGSIDVFNLTLGTVTVTAQAREHECVPQLGNGNPSSGNPSTPVALKAAQEQSVPVTFPGTCSTKTATEVTGNTTFKLIAQASGQTPPTEITLSVTVPPTPDWLDLLGFAAGLVCGLVLALGAYGRWRFMRYDKGLRRPTRLELLADLKGLEKSWTFSGSLATNLTAGSGLLVAVVGSSDFLNAVLSSNATNALAVATVAGLIGPALVAAAGVMTVALKRQTDTTPYVTALGFVLGTGVALGAAAGQVAAVTAAMFQAGIGTLPMVLLSVGGVAALLLLGGYGWTSIVSTLILGLGRTSKAKPHDQAKVQGAAQKLGAASLHGDVSHDNLARILGDEFLPSEPPTGTDQQALACRSALP